MCLLHKAETIQLVQRDQFDCSPNVCAVLQHHYHILTLYHKSLTIQQLL